MSEPKKNHVEDTTNDNQRIIRVSNDDGSTSLYITIGEEYANKHTPSIKARFEGDSTEKKEQKPVRLLRVNLFLSQIDNDGNMQTHKTGFLKPASQNPDAPIGIERDLENLDGLMEVYKEVAKSKPTVEGYKIQSFLDKYVFNTDNGRYALNQYLSENPRTEKPAKYTNNVKLQHNKNGLMGAEIISRKNPDGDEYKVTFKKVFDDNYGVGVVSVDIAKAKQIGPFKRYAPLCSKEALLNSTKNSNDQQMTEYPDLESFFKDPKAVQRLIDAKSVLSHNKNEFASASDLLENARQAVFDELNNREVALMRSMRNKRANG